MSLIEQYDRITLNVQSGLVIAGKAASDVVQRLALANRSYGYRRIGELLRREDWCVNHKRLVRIMREDNLLALRKPLFKPPTTNSRHTWRIWPNLARHLKVDPEVALRGANAKFTRRFRHIEETLGDRMGSASLEQMEALWQEAKGKGL